MATAEDELTFGDGDLATALDAAVLEDLSAEDIVAWAAATYGDGLCLTTSLTDALLIDLAARVAPGIEVIFLDTQYHFPETLETLEVVRARYPIRLTVLRPDLPMDDLWRTDTDACCAVRKVAQLDRALAGKTAWLSGLRRADSPSRATTPIVERDRRGLVKVNPIAAWTDENVADYLERHDVPVNPLQAKGYPSIGCWPCTSAVAEGDDPRSGRWRGLAKTECGLHL
jgi:phosphoadenosine phosphosulfate reductase